MRAGCPFGTHRVIEPKGVLPQAAWKIDNTMEIYDNEILIDVKTLNIDAASFTQIKKEANHDAKKIECIMLDIVGRRGKHHNPVTGSGGMLTGRVARLGRKLEGKIPLQAGDKIATLVSLSLTPLLIEEILSLHLHRDQVDIRGRAVLFETGLYAKLPRDIPESLALAVLDVAGAPAQTARLVKPGDTVLIIGAGGKSGMICAYEARKRAGVTGVVIGMASGDVSCRRMAELGHVKEIIQVDATDPLAAHEAVKKVTGGRMADVTINCVNIPGTEMASILATRDGGTVYFFSMATSFPAAALGAEGVGKDLTMLIGNGYTRDHAAIAFAVVRECPELLKMLEQLYT